MLQHQAPPKLKPLPSQVEEQTWFWRAVARVSRQRWLTVGLLLGAGVGGIVAADAVAEMLVDRLQRSQGDQDP